MHLPELDVVVGCKSRIGALVLLAALTALTALACDRKAPPRAAPDAGRRAPERDVPAVEHDVATHDAAPARAGCLDAYGAQIVEILPLEAAVDQVGGTFRFGREADALVYVTEWTGDLNEDGTTDLVARRDARGDREVRMVLVQCEGRFTLAWAGVARGIEVTAATRTDPEGIRWRDLRIDAPSGPRTFGFERGKYRPAP